MLGAIAVAVAVLFLLGCVLVVRPHASLAAWLTMYGAVLVFFTALLLQAWHDRHPPRLR